MRRGLVTTRQEAQAAIAAGSVLVAGAPATKAARLVAAGEPVVVLGPPARYVSRGGEKLEAALAAFAIAVTGRPALDAGASTGGFTDCLLQHGAAHVYAVDVGHGQLDPSLRADPRVTVLERVNVRTPRRSRAARRGPGVRTVSDGGRRPLLHLAGAVSRPWRVRWPRPGRPGPSGQAPVRGRESRRRRGKGVVRDPDVWLMRWPA